MKIVKLIVALILLKAVPSSCLSSFILTDNCQQAYTNIIALKIDSGAYYLNLEKQINPGNQLVFLFENYADFLTIYTAQNLDEYTKLKPAFNTRLKQLKSAESNSPYYLHCIGETYLHTAILHIQFGEYLKGLLDVKKAYKYFNRNLQAYPNFVLAQKSMGMLQTILGSVPQQYQNGLEFIGLKGNVDYGFTLLQNALKQAKTNQSLYTHEIATVLAFLQFHIQNQPQQAWLTLNSNNFNAATNKMDAFALGHIGIHGTHCHQGIAALKQAPKSADYLNFPYLNFLLGLGHTYTLQPAANQYFNQFVKTTQGTDYVKSAYHKMAWNALIHESEASYFNYLNNIPNQGRGVLDTDKQAITEYNKQQAPNKILLKARLLSDGNQLKQAQALLEKYHINHFKTQAHKTEFYYRKARVFDKLKHHATAKRYYGLTIKMGKGLSDYFAANSAYLIGFIYENEANFEKAQEYYNICLQIKNHEYENSISQKANAGINRIANAKH